MLKSTCRNVLLIIFLSVAAGTTPATAQTTHTINLNNFAFAPPDITIAIGDTVHWVWVDDHFHNVESGIIVDSAGVHDNNFRSGDATNVDGMTYDLTFDQAFLNTNTMPDHVYPFYCIVHVSINMAGTIKVLLAGECDTNADCDDGDACNGDETCVDNACQSGSAIVCDDGAYCNGEETCVEGVCQVGTTIDCDDSVDCTIDSCNEDTDTCDHTTNDIVCEDNLFCNGADRCHVTSGCIHAGSPCDAGTVCNEVSEECVACMMDEHCNDDIDCTIDRCINNACDHQALSSMCEDNLFCNGIEICKLTEGCKSLGNPCLKGVCDEATDFCANCLTDSDCDDGDDCTDDTCIIGECEFESIEDCGGTDDTPDDILDDNSDSPVGQVTPPLCGAFGMIPMFFMFFGLVGVRTQRRRKHTR